MDKAINNRRLSVLNMNDIPPETQLYRFKERRKKIIQKCREIKADLEYWNSINPNEPPLTLSFDFTDELDELEASNFMEQILKRSSTKTKK